MPSGSFCGCLEWGNAKVGAHYGGVVGELRPYERSRCAEHGVTANSALGKECARPTGGRHGRTDEGPAQRAEGAKSIGHAEGRLGAANQP